MGSNRPESSPAVVNLIRQQSELISSEKWQNCVRHVIKLESTFVNTRPNEIIISINRGSSESESDL